MGSRFLPSEHLKSSLQESILKVPYKPIGKLHCQMNFTTGSTIIELSFYACNLQNESGCFPDIWKDSNVTPPYKTSAVSEHANKTGYIIGFGTKLSLLTETSLVLS